jgi:hypothetical protein
MQGLNQTFQVSQLVLQNMFSPEGNWNWRKDDLKKAEELVKKDRNTDAANRPTGGKGV